VFRLSPASASTTPLIKSAGHFLARIFQLLLDVRSSADHSPGSSLPISTPPTGPTGASAWPHAPLASISSPKHLFYAMPRAGTSLMSVERCSRLLKSPPVMATTDQDPDVVVTVTPVQASPPIILAAVSRRRPRRRAGDRMRPSAHKIECNFALTAARHYRDDLLSGGRKCNGKPSPFTPVAAFCGQPTILQALVRL
jgi:hypothetical protein